MKSAIIIHGIDDVKKEFLDAKNSASNSHWFPWLQWELVKKDFLCQAPEMPKPYLSDMNYDDWSDVFSKFNIDNETVLIGHSCGGGFLLKYLSSHKNIKFNRLVLVAPWMDLEKRHPSFFADFELDHDLLSRCNKIDLFYSTDDEGYILSSVDKIKSIYGDKIKCHKFSDKGHFCESEIGVEFPELLKCILK